MAYSIKDFVDLTVEQRAVLEAFGRDDALCKTFYFTGGTLLKALGIVPRISNDLDFFTFPGVDSRAFLAQRKKVYTLLVKIFGEENIHATEDAYTHRPSSMVIDLVIENISLIDQVTAFGRLNTAGLDDITAGKAAALCSRDEIKDYIDIAFLTQRANLHLADLENLAERKYGLGTITEEKLLAELVAKREQFVFLEKIFLRDAQKHISFVQSQIATLIDQTTV
ncbi:nucleotidyl transferase AbiEii/AbiGii toxin family protein [Candidatus Uhrbacteria bacterium]|nr:nucleotidyl transferase AbiEii/AbiGii toxin family protein [Candidatus Uhrbacteria bacterium]